MITHRPTRTGLQIQRDVIYALVLREMGTYFGRSRVGLFWVLVEPLAHLIFPVVLAGFILERTVVQVEYPVLLVYGLLPFLLFKTVCLQTMEGTNTNRGLLSYRQITLMDVFIGKLISSSAIQAVVFTLVLTGLSVFDLHVVPPAPLELAAALALTIVLGFGLGLLFAALSSLIPDLKTIFRLLFVPLYFASGVLFPISRLPSDWVDVLAINPVLHLVELTRSTAVVHYEPMRQLNTLYPVGLALLVTFIGLAMYRLRYLSRVTS